MTGKPDEPRGRRHSPSSVKLYEQCPAAYHFQYVKRLPPPDGAKPVPEHWRFGRVVHKALEVAYQAHAAQPRTRVLADTAQVAIDALRAAWEAEEMPTHNGEFDRAVGIVLDELHREACKPEQILGVEHRFLVVSPDGTIMHGFSDLVLSLPGAALEIRDHKIRSTATPAEELVHDFQLNFYGACARETWPAMGRIYASHNYPPIGKRVAVALTKDGMDEAVARVEAVAEMIEMDLAQSGGKDGDGSGFRTRTGEWCKDCQYLAVCPAPESRRASTAIAGLEGF